MREISTGTVENWPPSIIVYTDGASRGNPGPASSGIVFYDQDENELYCFGEYLGEQTNNYAEYTAVKKAIEIAAENKVEELVLRSDSQLLVRQILGEYKVKSSGLKPIYLECMDLIKKIKTFKVEHVRREFNKKADEIANDVLDQ